MKQLNILKALAADCRDHGETDIADGIDVLVADVTELVEAIYVERAASDRGDSIAHLEARLRTTQSLVKFQVPASSAQDGNAPSRWCGWAVQYPGKMPKIFGDRCIAELNWYPAEGASLLKLVEIRRITSTSGEKAGG